jgi:hypothetical protein
MKFSCYLALILIDVFGITHLSIATRGRAPGNIAARTLLLNTLR